MNRKTIYVLFGLLIIALAAVGVGYGLWFEDLKIHGEVTTGELDIDFSWYDDSVFAYFSDENGDYVCDEFGVWGEACPLKFDTVTCEADVNEYYQIANPDSDDSDGYDPDWINIWVTGAYPSFNCDVSFDVNNAGTVPVHLAAAFTYKVCELDEFGDIIYDSCVEEALVEGEDTPLEDITCYMADYGFEGPIIEIGPDGLLYAGLELVQLHTDDEFWCTTKVHFTNHDTVGENMGYVFQLHLRGFQWNESPMLGDYPWYP